jgi:hypothetical protein
MKQFDGWYLQYIETLERMSPVERAKQGEGDHAGYLLRRFPRELTQGGFDVARLREWYQENEEYIGADNAMVVDADLQKLGISNRKPAFLDWLLENLGKDELALELAGCYLDGDAGKDAASAIAWIKSNRPNLFFSDTGGYRWFIDTNKKSTAGAKAQDVRHGER